MTDAEEHVRNRLIWRSLQHEGASLIIFGAGMSFSLVVALIFLPGSTSSTLFASTLLWAVIGSQTVMVALHERCRQWQDWHSWMIAHPHEWPWLPFPGEA